MIKDKVNRHDTVINKLENHHYEIEERVHTLENVNKHLEDESMQIKEDFLKLQTDTMKSNLIFNGISMVNGDNNENTEIVLKQFLQNELDINTDSLTFQNVHRLRPRRDNKPRGIIARFTRYSDREKVLEAVPRKLRDKIYISIFQQYPSEIDAHRSASFPK